MISYAPSKRTRESNMHVRSCRDIHVGPERVAASQCLPPHTHIVRVQALMIQCNLVTLTETRNATNIWHMQTGDPTDVLHINIPGGVDTQKRTAGNVKRREKGEGRERRWSFFVREKVKAAAALPVCPAHAERRTSAPAGMGAVATSCLPACAVVSTATG